LFIAIECFEARCHRALPAPSHIGAQAADCERQRRKREPWDFYVVSPRAYVMGVSRTKIGFEPRAESKRIEPILVASCDQLSRISSARTSRPVRWAASRGPKACRSSTSFTRTRRVFRDHGCVHCAEPICAGFLASAYGIVVPPPAHRCRRIPGHLRFRLGWLWKLGNLAYSC